MWAIGAVVVEFWYAAIALLWLCFYLFTSRSVSDRLLGVIVLWLMPMAALFLAGIWLMTVPEASQATPPSPYTKVAVGPALRRPLCGAAWLVSKLIAKRRKAPASPMTGPAGKADTG
ncbi:hypothetical protein FG93_01077 [Bosea sp. LC85]|uniref:hypothetical protein n=1 Tax=Bosea sp. LC85 TaxID=1502851 RepID=UPI0004E2FB6B|nr:hypothetical protein [Bosea sp. LC85]KFC74491.1 hypothetical protein FG93_01077 [Bosea sp. LC85]